MEKYDFNDGGGTIKRIIHQFNIDQIAFTKKGDSGSMYYIINTLKEMVTIGIH